MTDLWVGVPSLAERMAADKITITVTDRYEGNIPRIDLPLWRVIIRLEDRTMGLPYYTSESTTPPSPEEIMRRIITAAQSIEDADTVEEWAGVAAGENPDYMTENTFQWQMDQTEALRALLGARYDDYLRHTRL